MTTTFSAGKLSATALQTMRDDVDGLISGIGVEKIASADQSATVNSTTLVSDTSLSCPVTSGVFYDIDMFLIYSGSATGDFKYGFAIPTGTLHWSAHKYSPADVLELVQATNIMVSDNTNVAGGPGLGSYRHIVLKGSFAATASGFVTLRFASGTAVGGEQALRVAGSKLSLRPAYG